MQVAEKAWIAFRDAEADSIAIEYQGSTMEAGVHDACLADLTNQRIAQIDERIKDLDER